MTLVVRFKIRGNLRFLSHHETMAMFQRVFARARIGLCYSAGFNRRPKLSLPLPRSVGMLSDAELACALVCGDENSLDAERLKERICEHVPQGCEITGIELIEGNVRYRPVSAVYVFSLAHSAEDDRIRADIEALRQALAAGSGVVVERRGHGTKPARKIDVSVYVDLIEVEGGDLVVKCNITSAGTVRADEILQLLQIDSSQLSRPVTRRSIEWTRN